MRREKRVTVSALHPEFGLRDWIWGILLTLPFLATHWFTPVKMHWALAAMLYAYIALMIWTILMQLLAKRRPELFQLSMEVRDEEFELGRRWGRKVVVRFADVRQVVALSGIDGGGESDTTLVFHTEHGKVTVVSSLSYSSGLLDRVWEMPSFDRAAYATHDAKEGALLRCIVRKRTALLKPAR